MDFTAEAMQKTLDISNPEIHSVTDVHGIETSYSTKPLHQVIASAPKLPEKVSVSTLAGLADLVRAALEGQAYRDDYLLHVEDERTVSLKKKVSDEYGRRLQLVVAQPVPFKQFAFGQWLGQEEFTIALASLFAESEDKGYVLHLASSLTNDATSNLEDDGFTQRAQIKAGLRLKDTVTIKPRVKMAPYRTFPELDQPISEFVFRARGNGEQGPSLMLVEADGGRWKLDAIAKIKAAVEAFDLKIPVVA